MTVLDAAPQMEWQLEEKVHRQRVGGKVSQTMEHNEAIEMMASEKYLLDELTPELRDAYEEHYFGCAECALDVQFGAAFIGHAKVVLPEMMMSMPEADTASHAAPARPRTREVKEVKQKRDWFAWLRPAVMAPVFACLLACMLSVIGYQNLVVNPALQAAAIEPRILPRATILPEHPRSPLPVIYADLKLGSTITVELPAGVSYSSYKLDFYDSNNKMIWSRTTHVDPAAEDSLSFWLSSGIKQDTYKVVIYGVTPAGGTAWVTQQIFDLQMKK